MVQSQKPLVGGPCFAQLGQAWAKGRQEPGFGFSGAAGELQTPLSSVGELAEMAEGDREHPRRPRETGGLAGPSGDGALIAATVSAEGLWETHVLPDLSADYFLQNKKALFSYWEPPLQRSPSSPLSVSLPHAHVFAALGDFSSAGL